jgi:hypothetical protein
VHAARLPRLLCTVLLDLLHAIPTAGMVRLAPGEEYQQGTHVLLLQGSLESAGAAGEEPVPAPALLPWLTHHRFSFVAALAASQQQQLHWTAGSSGVTLMVCSSDGSSSS